MKRFLALALALIMVAALVACGGSKPATSTPADTGKVDTDTIKDKQDKDIHEVKEGVDTV